MNSIMSVASDLVLVYPRREMERAAMPFFSTDFTDKMGLID